MLSINVVNEYRQKDKPVNHVCLFIQYGLFFLNIILYYFSKRSHGGKCRGTAGNITTLPHHNSWVDPKLLRLLCVCVISHVLPVSAWVFSGFLGNLLTPKNQMLHASDPP